MESLSCQIDLDSRHMGWVTSELPGGDHHVIKIEMKGPENTLRVRQVKVLGWKEGETIKIAGQISASMAQQKNCEAETLRVFRLITSQVSEILFRYTVLCGEINIKKKSTIGLKMDSFFIPKAIFLCVGVWKADLWGCRAYSRAGGEEPAVISRG